MSTSRMDRLEIMCATDEGRQKGERWCKRAIWGNTLPADKHVWRSVNKLTSAAFIICGERHYPTNRDIRNGYGSE